VLFLRQLSGAPDAECSPFRIFRVFRGSSPVPIRNGQSGSDSVVEKISEDQRRLAV
jgi:hypothetical protein